MSIPDRRPEPEVPTTSLKRKQLSDGDQKELDALDGVFKRIKKTVMQSPYIISTPSMHPYMHHSKHEARAWMMGDMFTPEEEHLQYRTFLYREMYQDCFTLQHGEDDEPEAPRPTSQVLNPASSQPKKKVPFGVYKSKQANGVIAPGSKKVSPTLPPTPAAPAQTNGVKSPERQTQATPEKAVESKAQKRSPSPQPVPPVKPTSPPKEEEAPEPPAPPSNKPEATEPKPIQDLLDASNGTPHGLPPLLSPVGDDLGAPYGLPAILSPTLPPQIQTALDEIEKEKQRARADSNTSASSSDRRTQLLAVPKPHETKQDANVKTSPRARSLSQDRLSPRAVPSKSKEETGNRLIVKLKYGKKNRDTIKRLLNLPAKRDHLAEKRAREATPKAQTPSSQAKANDAGTLKQKPIPKVAARRPESSTAPPKPASAAPKAPDKRPRTDDDVDSSVPAKRARASTLQDGPNTPRDQIASSPALSSRSSAQKGQQSQYTTPRKDLKAACMLRVKSTDSHDSTPGRSSITPSGSLRNADGPASSKAPPTSAPVNTKKQADISALAEASMKLNQMGRALKHESQKLEHERSRSKVAANATSNGKSSASAEEDHKRAAVTALECILAYMAAFHTQDAALHLRGRPAEVESTWKTLLPLCVSYARLTKEHAFLDGLRSHLGAVIAGTICTHLSARAQASSATGGAAKAPHDSPHEILPHADLAKQYAHASDTLALLAEHVVALQRHSLDARISLPVEALQRHFPKTWAGAEKNGRLAKAPEKLLGAGTAASSSSSSGANGNAAAGAAGVKLGGPYFLPLGADTTAVQAVRFGARFLKEWCKGEGVPFVAKLVVDGVRAAE